MPSPVVGELLIIPHTPSRADSAMPPYGAVAVEHQLQDYAVTDEPWRAEVAGSVAERPRTVIATARP